MTAIQHVDQLLELHDAAFVDAAYQALLGRAPDPEGMRYYLGRLRAGYGKARVIAQMAESAEAKTGGADLAGLREMVAAEKKASHWLWGLFSRGSRVERQVYRMENQLDRMAQQLARLGDAAGVIQASVNGLAVNTVGVTAQPAPNPPVEYSNIDFSRLAPRARYIMARLTQAVARSAEGKMV